MGLRLAAALAGALALAAGAAAAPRDDAAAFLLSRQAAGAFAEAGEQPTAGLTAWAVLGLAAVGRAPAAAGDYLRAHEPGLQSATDVELGILAERALGLDASALVTRLRGLPAGTLNSTFWGMLALASAGEPVPPDWRASVLAGQSRAGGWGWAAGVGPDADDTAAAIEALRAAGVAAESPAIQRGLAYLRSAQGRDGGFAQRPGGSSNAQTTAWALMALRAAGADPGKRPYRYLAGLRRADGSYRYDAKHATTPAWVTSYVLVALAGRWYPVVPA